MFTRHKDTAPKRPREKLTSTWLLARGDVPGDLTGGNGENGVVDWALCSLGYLL